MDLHWWPQGSVLAQRLVQRSHLLPLVSRFKRREKAGVYSRQRTMTVTMTTMSACLGGF